LRKLLPLVVILLVLAGIGVAAQQAYAQLTAPPEQPIAFPHTAHVQVAQLDCQFCHRTAAVSPQAGVPAVQQCLFCHQVVRTERPEIQKLIGQWEQQQAIEWERVHRMPDHVRFVHSAHIQAGVECSTCHGNVGQMQVVQQVRPLNMGDCVNCHRQNNAPTDCSFCHY
jgi:cytochrome c553